MHGVFFGGGIVGVAVPLMCTLSIHIYVRLGGSWAVEAVEREERTRQTSRSRGRQGLETSPVRRIVQFHLDMPCSGGIIEP